jgi:hypothetical protein
VNVYARCRDWLTRPRADRAILLLSFVLLLPALTTGLSADDYLHTIMLDRPCPIPGFQRGPLDVFRFCDPRDFPALLRQGLFSWWDDPHARLAFMRPLTAATHALDHALARNGGVWMHLHSALWTLLLLFGVRALYRELIAERLLANLALALYALDDARGWLVSWVAARNAAIATGLSVWALVFHRRARLAADGGGWLGRLAGPLLFACALLAGEGALAIAGYLAGYALFLERGRWRERLLTLWPYVAIAIVWRVVYRALDYGAYGSAIYLDPASEPLAFAKVLFEHAPVLLGSQLGGMWSDASTLLFALPRLEVMVSCVTWLFILWVGWQMWQQLRDEPLSRFAAFGALAALMPAAAVSPIMDRLLTWVGVGASVLVAQLIAPLLRSSPPSAAAAKGGARATAVLLLLVHAANAALLPARARGNLIVRDILDRAGAAVPRDPSVTDKTLIYVNPPFVPYAGYLPIERAAQGIPRPRAQHILAVAITPLHLERLDRFTLRLRPRDGFLIDPLSKLLWSEHRPFHEGERIVQGDMTVTVTHVSADHRPLEIEARFARPLEDPSYIWVQWQGMRSAPFTPPGIGDRSVLAGADFLQSFLGVELPFAARL